MVHTRKIGFMHELYAIGISNYPSQGAFPLFRFAFKKCVWISTKLLYADLICLSYHLRMCRSLMPGDDESMSDEAIWETLPVSH